MSVNHLRILGTRGVPAQHGGFETFAEHLALYLAEQDWRVSVYCQEDGAGPTYEDTWQGIRRVHIPVAQSGAKGTVVFDWKATRHACREPGIVLTLGYNTAAFCVLYRLKGIKNIINMDGIEWKRAKWAFPERACLYLNEHLGCWLGNHIVADHPEIANHLATRIRRSKITMIPYGADRIDAADPDLLKPYGLTSKQYVIVIARPEPENSIREIVSAFSSQERRAKLVVLGNFDAADPAYRHAVLESASDEVLFPGAIYDKPIMRSLRFHARLYIHGHQVGGTNPSLVEALAAGSPVLAHDNKFNRWVAGTGATYFRDANDCTSRLDAILHEPTILRRMSSASLLQFQEHFPWTQVLQEYTALLTKHHNC